MGALVPLVAAAILLPGGSAADQASDPMSVAAGQIDAGRNHTCAVIQDGQVRCWGYGPEGELGYATRAIIGDNETPGRFGPVNLGAGRRAVAISAGDFHTCALLDDQTVRCWGFGGNGRLGYGNVSNVGDDEHPGSVGPVDLGFGRKAKAIAAGGAHTCALLDDDTVRCWGYAYWGQLGYGNPEPTEPPPAPGDPPPEPDPLNIGDNEPPGSVGPVNLGAGRKAKAITAGDSHTCAVLDDDTVTCWGSGASGRLGYGNQRNVGDRDTVLAGPVSLGANRTAKAISAGGAEVCALLDDGTVRCWGFGGSGRLGYGNMDNIGDDELPDVVGPLNLGATATAIGVGDGHACALLADRSVRCWGSNVDGRLGYANRVDIGDNEVPASAGPVDLGAGRTAAAIALGARHTCARLDDANVRCWGYGANGRLGYCSERNVGDDETPASRGPVDLGVAGSGAPACPPAPTRSTTSPAPTGTGSYPLATEARRRTAFRSCLRRAARHTTREIRRARRMSPSRRARAKRHIKRHRSRLRRACVRRHGRTPGRVTGLTAKAVPRRKVVLTFRAPGSDGSKPPAARAYLVKQSLRPIRGARGFRRAQTLCKGRCRFPGVTEVGARITLDVTGLRPRTTYYYAVAARDNVSGKLGRRSRPVKVRTR